MGPEMLRKITCWWNCKNTMVEKIPYDYGYKEREGHSYTGRKAFECVYM